MRAVTVTLVLAAGALVVAPAAHAQAPLPVPPPPPVQVAPAPTPPPVDESPPPAGEPSALPPLMGRVLAYLRAPLRDAPLEQASTSVWLELRPRLGPSYAKVVVTADAFAASVASVPDVRGRVREGYVGIGDERVDLRIGQQILPWGNADAVNPTDLLTARDLAFFSADPEANRLGVLTARAAWTPARWLSVALIGVPVAPVSTLLLPAALVPPGVTLQPVQRPAATIGNAEEAARVAVSGDGWDIAVIGFRGWNHTPELQLRGVRPDGTIDVGLAQHGYLAGGAEASVSIARWVLRAETAYVSTDNPTGTNPLVQPTHWDSVVGVERSFFDQHVRVQAQGISRFHPNYSPPSAARGPDAATTGIDIALAHANAVLENYVSQVRVAASLRVAYATSDDRIGLEVFALANVNDDHDFLLRPLVTYRPTDAMKLEAGAEIYGGPAGSPLGALSDYGGAFAQATYEF